MHRVLLNHPRLPLFGAQATRALERATTAGLTSGTLMQRAGAATGQLALALAPHSPRFWVAAGQGNNGGDGLEAARWLHVRGHHVGVTLFADPARLPTDARDALKRAETAGVQIHADWPEPKDALVIDALLGLGLQPSQRSHSVALACGLRALQDHIGPLLAVDLPSGLHADTGEGLPSTPRATATLSLLTLKPGLFTGRGRDLSGEIWWHDLGIVCDTAPQAWLNTELAILPRTHQQHKGSFGDVTVIGGASGMTGAALLAGTAAMAAGAGRVYVSLLDGNIAPSDNPGLMLRAWEPGSRPSAWSQQTLVCGCGGGEAITEVLPSAMSLAERLVIDADGLNALSAHPSLQRQLHSRSAKNRPTILTPHPLEAARLLSVSVGDIQSDRLHAAQSIAERWGCTVILKGSGTVIAAPQSTPWVNLSGNASLATAGTGDVLAGWLGAWWAQSPGQVPQVVAAQAVARHGAAAEPAAPGPLRAQDLIERMHQQLRAPNARATCVSSASS